MLMPCVWVDGRKSFYTCLVFTLVIAFLNINYWKCLFGFKFCTNNYNLFKFTATPIFISV